MPNILDFIKRNAPVFFIGGITILIFIIIIVVAQRNPITPPTLIEVEEATDLVAPHTYTQGRYDAPITIVEFSDFGCPACKSYHPVMTSLVREYPEHIRWAYRHFPLAQHENADKAAIAAQVAGDQKKFWEYAELLFNNQGNFEEDNLIEFAEYLGLDIEQFMEGLNNPSFEDLIFEDINYAKGLGVNSTPTFLLNGKQLRLRNINDLRDQVELELERLGLLPKPSETTESSPEEGPSEILSTPEDKSRFEKINRVYGILEIEYTEEGFKPKEAKATSGQLVVWTNTTEKDIKIQQLMPKYEELKEPVSLPAGGTFEFRLRESGLWTYKEEGSTVSRSTIMIQNLPEGF